MSTQDVLDNERNRIARLTVTRAQLRRLVSRHIVFVSTHKTFNYIELSSTGRA